MRHVLGANDPRRRAHRGRVRASARGSGRPCARRRDRGGTRLRRRTRSADARRASRCSRSAERSRLGAYGSRASPSNPGGARACREPTSVDHQRSRPCRCWHTGQGLDPTNPCDRGQIVNQGTGLRVGVDADATQQAFEQERAAWPPVEQDDTSDELHENPWWQQLPADTSAPSPAEAARAFDVFGAVPTGSGARAGLTSARQCIDIRDMAIRQSADAGGWVRQRWSDRPDRRRFRRFRSRAVATWAGVRRLADGGRG
jgi:hypothetical protein